MPFVRVGTHPTRDFAHLLLSLARGRGHFCHALHVAMQIGLYLLHVSWSLAYSLYGLSHSTYRNVEISNWGCLGVVPPLAGCSPIQPNFLLPLHGIGEVRRGSCSPLRQRFFHLRTVIVTAGVHQRFGSRLPLPCGSMTSPLNVLTLARHQPLYFSLRFRRDLCFW